ncbi:hypothetical protein Bca4012_077283 [Brassica carinata]
MKIACVSESFYLISKQERNLYQLYDFIWTVIYKIEKSQTSYSFALWEESTEDDCISSDAYGSDHGEKRVKQSTQKKLNAKVSSKPSEQKSLAKTGKQKLRLKEEEASLTKPQEDWKAYNPMTMRPPPLPEGTMSIKIMTWNVNGLRALLKLESFSPLQLAQRENFDVLCFQEAKIQVKDVEEVKKALSDGYDHSFWSCSVSKLGYSGTAIISRVRQECA